MLGLITLAGLGAMCMGNPPRRKKRRRNPYGGPEQNQIETVRITKPKGRRNPKKRKGKKRSGGGVSPGGAASRLAHWRWHHNPVHEIHRGDTVTIRTPHGGKFTGKAYLLGTHGWVLGAGPHGARTAIANADNIIDVRKRRK